MSFLQRITQSVSKLLSKSPPSTATNAPKRAVAHTDTISSTSSINLEREKKGSHNTAHININNIEKEREMRQTAVRLAHAYTPMIKFLGGRHPIIEHGGQTKAHPCTIDGLLPGSKDCLPVGEFLSKLRPFKVVPYNNSESGAKKSTSSSSGGATQHKSKYLYVDRPLEKNEVTSVSQLPQRFRFKPIDDNEADVINGGGAY